MRTLKAGPNGSFVIVYSDNNENLSRERQLGSMDVIRYPLIESIELVRAGQSSSKINIWKYDQIINGTTGLAFTSYAALDAWISANLFLAPGTGSGGGGGTAGGALETTQQFVKTAAQSIDTKTPALVGGSVPVHVDNFPASVEISNDAGSPLPVAGTVSVSNFPASTEISNDSGNPIPVSGTFYQATQPISAATLPLPTGAATGAKQDTGNTSLASIDGKLPATIGQKAKAASLSVALATDQDPLTVSRKVRTPVDGSGSITTGGTAQLAMAANAAGQIYKLQNLSNEVLWFSEVSATPTPFGAGCFSLAPYNNGASGYYESTDPVTTAVYIYGATTTSKFTLIKS